MQYFIGIDNGGTLVKAAIYDENGKRVACARELLEMEIPAPGWSERDMEKLWEANCQALKRVLGISDVAPEDIKAISFSGHGKGIYLVDEKGRPVRKGILSTDARASGIVQTWQKNGIAEKMYEHTHQALRACQPICLLRWLAEKEPETLAHTKWIFGVNDYIGYRMTGIAGGELTNYSGSGMMDLDNRCISHEVLKLAGLEDLMEKCPPLLNPEELAGFVTKEAAKAAGLPEGIVCAAGLFDIDACAIGMGITDHSRIAILAGTWGIHEYISTKYVEDSRTGMNSCYCIKGWYLVEESSPTSVSNFEWFVRNIVRDKWMGTHTRDNLYDYADHLAEELDIHENIPVFLPYLFGGPAHSNAFGCFLGLQANHTYSHMIRSIMEGIVFCHRQHLEKLLETRKKPCAVRLGGGICASDFWVQMFADVLKIPVELQDTEEPGTLGAAMSAAIACGHFHSFHEAVEQTVHIKTIVYPDRKAGEIYQKKYEEYLRTVKYMEGY